MWRLRPDSFTAVNVLACAWIISWLSRTSCSRVRSCALASSSWRAAARQEEDANAQLRTLEQEVRLSQEMIQAQASTFTAVKESGRNRHTELQELSDLLCLDQLL